MDYNFIQAKLNDIVIHKVGNKFTNENNIFGKPNNIIDEKLKAILTQFFLSSIRSNNFYNFDNEVDLSHNVVFSCVSKIFKNPLDLYDQSINLAKYLYSRSNHPNIKSGEFFVCYFKDCNFENEMIDAIGIFKTEIKDTFLEVEQKEDAFLIYEKHGINVNKLDKGCIIFNKNNDNGFFLKIIDNVNKGYNARYWKDDFLSVSIWEDEYFKTNSLFNLTRKFIKSKDFLQHGCNSNSLKDIDVLNKSSDYFKGNEFFNIEEFKADVLKDEKTIELFDKFGDKNDLSFLSEDFKISDLAVNKKIKSFNRVIKLDKSFKIYIQGEGGEIEKNIDDDGRKYYKLYYESES